MGLINKKDILTIVKNYHARSHNNDYKRWNLGFGFIHYSFIRNIRPKKVLVVGSQRGYVPVICAKACKDEDHGGHVDFVDAGYDMNISYESSRAWGGTGVWREIDESYWKPLEVQKYITMYCMTIENFVDKYPDRKYEYIYIDADHNYDAVKSEFNLLWPKLKEDGFISFHDVVVRRRAQAGRCGVKKFWDEIKGDYHSFTFEQSNGLGIIQKQKE